jgi:putative PIN family toxin of toxin-antitoxin system
MVSIVLDANVLAPGFLNRASVSGQLITAWSDEVYELVISEHLLGELTRTYSDPYFRRRVEPREVEQITALLRRRATLTELTVPVTGVATQPKDDLVLSTALSGGASLLATRDRQLLKLRAYQTVRILHPGELVNYLSVSRSTGDQR